MITHILFYFIYLVGLSWSADRYHKNLKRISTLQGVLKLPNAKKEVILKDLDLANNQLKKDKKKSFIILTSIFVAHQGYAIIISSFFFVYNYGLTPIQMIYPIIAFAISLLILLTIFWLKGKGGGIPNNRGMKEFPGSYF